MFILLGQQAKLIDARGADFIHHRDDVAVLGPSIALHVHSFIEAVGDQILDLSGDVILGDLGILQSRSFRLE